MIKIDIQTNVKEITASLGRFTDDLRNKAVVRALNKTAAQARTDAAKQVRAAGYNIKSSAIKKSFKIKQANSANLVVTLTASGKPIGLINYNARQTKKGVSVQVERSREILRHAFIITMRNGHQGVFERVGAARLTVGGRSGSTRVKGAGRVVAGRVKGASPTVAGRVGGGARRANLPIEELFGPSIPSSLANATVRKAIMEKIRTVFPKILKHEIKFLQKKK